MRACPRSRRLYDQRKVRGEKGTWKFKLKWMTIYTMKIVCIGRNRNNVGGQAQGHRPTTANPCVCAHILRLQGCGQGCNVVTACVLCDRCLVENDQTTRALHTAGTSNTPVHRGHACTAGQIIWPPMSEHVRLHIHPLRRRTFVVSERPLSTQTRATL